MPSFTILIYRGISDPALPTVPKEYLQDYDNYQIYDIVCIDDVKTTYISGSIVSIVKKEKLSFLAIQAYSPVPILCNFIEIVNTYP